MATVPSFDPNTFIPSIKAKDWQALQKDEGDPLVNRAISCLPPGSTFKLVTALAGLRSSTKNLSGAKYSCGGGVSYGDHFFRCWVAEKHYTHGTIGLADALRDDRERRRMLLPPSGGSSFEAGRLACAG